MSSADMGRARLPREGYTLDPRTAAEFAAREKVLEPLADTVRDLVDAVVRSQVPDEELDAVRQDLEGLVARLRAQQLPGPHGVRFDADGGHHTYGNPVVGKANAIATPLRVHREPDHSVWAETTLGAAYEGPPGLVHGGVSALLLDQMLGEAASAGGRPGMTGTLSLRYRKGTRLGPVRIEAKAEEVRGIKTIVRGRIIAVQADAEADSGRTDVCVEAEGLFILPRWARDGAVRGPVGDEVPD